MIRDITLGQYFPGESVVHRLDPRTKILWTLIFMILVFMATSFSGYLLLGLFVAGIVALSGVPPLYILRGIKPFFMLMVFTAGVNVFMTNGTTLFEFGFLRITNEGVRVALFMILRLTLLVMGTTMMTFTTSPILLTDGIESLLKPFTRFGVPAHDLAMMMSIALRFIPTLLEETDKIIKAQTARGADFETGNILARARALTPILVPLFISAFRRADDLAIAMECRCYQGGANRTRMKQLRYSYCDLWAALIAIALIAALLLVRFIPI